MQFFNGRPRKLALLALGFFLVGWVVYLLGSCWVLATWTGKSANGRYVSKTDPDLTPFYAVLVGGPFVLLLGLLHAALPGLSSVIVGAISVFPSTFFVVCVSIVSAESVWNIALTLYHDNHTVDTQAAHPLHPTTVVLLIGTLILGLSWLTVMICSLFYSYQSEYWIQVPRQNTGTQSRTPVRRSPFGPGKARVESVPVIIASAICWLVIVVQLPVGKWFPFDGIILVGPLLHLAMLLHAGCYGGASTVSGIFASIFSVMYMAFIGTALSSVDYACSVHSCRNVNSIKDGGIIGLIVVSTALCLWPLYLHYPSSSISGENHTQSVAAAQQLEERRMTPSYGTSQSQRQSSDTQPLIN